MKHIKLSLLAIIFTLFIAGCSTDGFDPEVLIKANEQVNTFLEEYPNADLNLLYYSQNESSQLSEEYLQTCNRELTPKNLYRFNIVDTQSGLNILGYLDSDNQVIDCLKRDTSNNQPSLPTDQPSDGSSLGSSPDNSFFETDQYLDLTGFELSEESNLLINEISSYLNTFPEPVELDLYIGSEGDNLQISDEVSAFASDELLYLWESLVLSVQSDIENSDSSNVEISLGFEREFEDIDDNINDMEFETQVSTYFEGYTLSRQSNDLLNDIESLLDEVNSEVALYFEFSSLDGMEDFNSNSFTLGEIPVEVLSLWEELLFNIESESESLENEFEIEIEIERILY